MLDRVYENDGLLPYLYDPIKDLYDSWYKSPWNPQKYTQYLFMKQIPFVSWNMSVYEGNQSNDEYMNRYGLTWDDITHPQRLPGTSQLSNDYRVGVNFVSKNIERLYK